MGAQSIDIDIKGRRTFPQIRAIFDKQVIEDKDRNGHQEGYSGDFQTVGGVKDKRNQIYDNYQIAYDSALELAQKWEYVVAVEYYGETKETKGIKNAKDRLNVLRQEEEETRKKLNLKFKHAGNTVTCSKCDSRFKRSLLNTTTCVLCRNNLFSKTDQKALINKRTKVDNAREKLQILELKQAKNKDSVNTLICGWGAC